MNITEEGYDNILEQFERHNIDLDIDWLRQHIDQIALAWPAADDEEYVKDYRGEEVWWTFENEVNGGGIGDTCQREKLIDQVALILTGMNWPCYGDTEDVKNKFWDAMAPYLTSMYV